MKPIRIERRELHGQMVDVAVYGPPSECGRLGWINLMAVSPSKSDSPGYRSMSSKAFQHCLLAGDTRGS